MRSDASSSIERNGWALVSGEERHALHPETFPIPSRLERESLSPGDAAQLLFDIETRDGERVIDRGVDRLWVIVRRRVGDLYHAVLDSDPGRADGLTLREGAEVVFSAEHVIAIAQPPEGYVLAKYGPGFFE